MFRFADATWGKVGGVRAREFDAANGSVHAGAVARVDATQQLVFCIVSVCVCMHLYSMPLLIT